MGTDFYECGIPDKTQTFLLFWNLRKTIVWFNKKCALLQFELWMDAKVSENCSAILKLIFKNEDTFKGYFRIFDIIYLKNI